jgi:IS30 family transposase
MFFYKVTFSTRSLPNKDTNGLIRQYFPKSRDFSTITQNDIDQVMNKLNNRPENALEFKHPIRYFLA